jgi:DNA-3-methyladenine glycosylase II
MSRRIDTEADLEAGLAALLTADPHLGPAAVLAGKLPLRRRAGGFTGLAGIVVSQQLSTASANAIWGRLAAAYDPFTPQALIRARATRLAGLGLSAPKIRALKEIAKAIAHGRLDCDALPDLPADAAHAALCEIHGIGPWSADIYLLACLGHPDAGRPAILPCRRRRGSPSPCRRGPRSRKPSPSPIPGVPGAAWRHGCCGPTIAPSSSAILRRCKPLHRAPALQSGIRAPESS